ncbi:hypothetical protein ANSO36C_30240 [Nostoc cf. commune SO-36]|uniref:Uncharacterized protein n=1 Tax=Nostoc cf. commune SO-36 TaxID=449208 RepID=A0ABM7Z2L8_NOSCO|nr:hypothetical protein ANSO36C_30240 [Nostoc cf. commune SO-36]
MGVFWFNMNQADKGAIAWDSIWDKHYTLISASHTIACITQISDRNFN